MIASREGGAMAIPGRWQGHAPAMRLARGPRFPEDESVRQAHADILLVDDDDDLRFTLAELLEDHGYFVEQARSAGEALSYLGQRPRPAVIILDLMMPGVSGVALREELMARDELREVPRLICTAASERHLADDELEPDVLLRKPLSVPTLLERLTELVGPPRY
jgi:CheY-like chemotaxis protein